MSNIDAVTLKLIADVNEYNTRIEKAERTTDQRLGAIEAKGFAMGQSLKKAFSLASTAAVAFAGSIVVDKLIQATKFGLDYASSLGEVAAQLGVTTDALQEYRYAATQVGLSSDEMDQALSQLTRRIGEGASGTKAQAEAFEKLGVTVKDVEGKVLNAGDAIPQIADALQKIKSPAERAAILMDLFGRAGQKLEPLLSGGSKAVNELRDAAHKLGVVLSNDQIQRADETADKLAALKTVMSANIAGAVANNTNAILAFANALATLVNWIGTAVTAYQKLKLLQGEAASRYHAFTSLDPNLRAEGTRMAERFRVERARLDPKNIDQKGGFRDYTLAPIPGYDPNRAPGLGAAAPAVATPKGGAGGGAANTGPSAAEIQQRYLAEVGSLMGEYTSIMQGMAKTAEERAELDLRHVELARLRNLAEINANDEYSKAQKEDLRQRVEQNAEVARARVEFEKSKELEQEKAELLRTQNDIERSELEAARDGANTIAERREIGLALIDLEYELKKALLEQVIASQTATDAMKQRAQVELDNLNGAKQRDQAGVKRDTEGPLAQYIRRNDPAKNGERAEQLVVDELEHVQRGISSALSNAIGAGDDPLISGLIDMLLQDILFRPLAEALEKGGGLFGGGGGGLFGNLFGGLFGGLFADGGRPPLGKVSVVGERGPELFVPDSAGAVVPNHLIGRNLASGAGGATSSVVQIQVVEGQMFEVRTRQISGEVSVQTVRGAAPEIIDAAAKTTMARAARPRL